MQFFKLPILFVFILFALTSYSENSKVDSLNSIINSDASSDTSKVRALLLLAEQYYKQNIDTTFLIIEKALNIAEKSDFKEGLGESNYWLGYLEESRGNGEIAANYYRKSFQIDSARGDLKAMATELNSLGYNFRKRGMVEKALAYYHKSLDIRNKIDDQNGIAYCLNNIGAIYKDQGKISETLKYWHESLRIRQKINDQDGIASSLNNIGAVHQTQGDYEKAIEYWEKSLAIKKEQKDLAGMAKTYNNIGFTYEKMNRYDDALTYLNKSLNLYKQFGSKAGEAYILMNLGSIYHDKMELDTAFSYFKRGLEIQENLSNPKHLAMGYIRMARVMFDLNIINNTTENYAEKGLKVGNELGFPQVIRDAAETLSWIYEKQGKDREAFQMYKLFVNMRDSLHNSETERIAAKQEAQFEYEKEKAIIEMEHQKEIALNQKEQDHQKLIKYIVTAVLIVVLVLLIVLFNKFVQGKKQSKIIQEQNEELNQTNEELHAQRDQLDNQKQLIESKHREIQDSISYAKRIQSAILPPSTLIDKALKDNFVLYLPKDVVAGDFYWIERIEDGVIFAVADCTGHGVPGAMVSVVCHNALNRCVREFQLSSPAAILNKAREIVVEEFHNSMDSDTTDDVRDGMDIALCALKGNELHYAGANNPLWIIQNNELVEFAPHKQPIGMVDNPKPFINTTIKLNKEDMIYLFTDGYVDQFGGPKDKKFGRNRLRNFLMEIHQKEAGEQQVQLSTTIGNWMRESKAEQLDDICFLGIKHH